jgi:hypothetical protein
MVVEGHVRAAAAYSMALPTPVCDEDIAVIR